MTEDRLDRLEEFAYKIWDSCEYNKKQAQKIIDEIRINKEILERSKDAERSDTDQP